MTSDPTPTRSCVYCGKDFPKNKNVSWQTWAGRRACSIACSNRSRTMVPRPPSIPKLCERCGVAIVRDPRLSEKQWAVRRFCGMTCSAAPRSGRKHAARIRKHSIRSYAEPVAVMHVPRPRITESVPDRIRDLAARKYRPMAIAAELRIPYRDVQAVLDRRME